MGIGPQYQVPGINKAFRHDLMTYPVINHRDTLLVGEFLNLRLEFRHRHTGTGESVVEWNKNLLGIEHPSGNLVKRLQRPSAGRVVCHHQVQICQNKIPCMDLSATVIGKYFLCNGLSHIPLVPLGGYQVQTLVKFC